jgi:hypothetical protein
MRFAYGWKSAGMEAKTSCDSQFGSLESSKLMYAVMAASLDIPLAASQASHLYLASNCQEKKMGGKNNG